MENWERLKCPIALPIGTAFDSLAEYTPRALLWVTDYGFKLLGRLFIDPKLLWREHLIGIFIFVLCVNSMV